MPANMLSPQDSSLFFELFIPLLAYTNKTYNVVNIPRTATLRTLPMESMRKIADYLWSHENILNDYIKKHGEFRTSHLALLESWKRHMNGTFFIMRHEKEGSLFIGSDPAGGKTDHAFLVKGLKSSIEEMILFTKNLPATVQCTLLPFKDAIITDGLFAIVPVRLADEDKKRLERSLELSIKEGRYSTSL